MIGNPACHKGVQIRWLPCCIVYFRVYKVHHDGMLSQDAIYLCSGSVNYQQGAIIIGSTGINYYRHGPQYRQWAWHINFSNSIRPRLLAKRSISIIDTILQKFIHSYGKIYKGESDAYFHLCSKSKSVFRHSFGSFTFI